MNPQRTDDLFLSDSRRDALRYQGLLLALDQSAEIAHEIEEEKLVYFDDTLERLLSSLADAVSGEQAFLAHLQVETPENPTLEIVADYPRKDRRGKQLQYQAPFSRLSDQQDSLVLDSIVDMGKKPIEGLELFDATAAILVRFKIANAVYILGVCNHRNPETGPFLAADRIAIESMVDLAVLGMDLGERRRREIRSIQETALEINAETSLEDVFLTITRLSASTFDNPCCLMLWDEAHEILNLKAQHGLSKGFCAQYAISKDFFYRKFSLQEPKNSTSLLSVLDISTQHRDLLEQEGLSSDLCAILQFNRETLGVLVIFSKDRQHRFTSHEVELAEIFASQASLAIHNAHTRRQVLREWQLNSEILRASRDLKELTGLFIERVMDFFKLHAASLVLRTDLSDEVNIHTSRGLPAYYQKEWSIRWDDFKEKLKSDGGYVPWLFLDLDCEDFGSWELNHRLDDLCSVLVVPLVSGAQLNGLLVLYHKQPGRRYTLEELEMVQIFASQVATAIHALTVDKKTRDILEKVLQTGQAIANEKKEEGLAFLARNLRDLVNVTFSHLLLYDEKEHSLEVAAFHPAPRKEALRWKPVLGKKVYLKQNPIMAKIIALEEPRVFHRGDVLPGTDMEMTRHIEKIVHLNGEVNEVLIYVLKTGDRLLGVCTLGEMRTRQDFKIEDEKIRRAKMFTDQAISFIDRLRLQDLTDVRARQEKSLRLAAEAIARMASHPLADLTQHIAKSACELLGADCAVLYPYYSDLKVYDTRNIASWNLKNKKKDIKAKTRSTPGSLTEYIIQNGELAVDDVHAGWDNSRQVEVYVNPGGFQERESIRSYLALCLRAGDEPVGILFVNFRQLHPLQVNELETMRIFGNQAGVAIQQARQFSRGQKKQHAIGMMHRIAGMIGGNHRPDKVYGVILDGAMNITGAQSGYVLAFDPVKQKMVTIHQRGIRRADRDRVYPALILKKLLADRKPVLTLDVREDRESQNHPSLVRSLVAAAFSDDGNDPSPGMILLESDVAGVFSPEDRDMLDDLAKFTGLAMKSAQYFSQLNENALLMTGLLSASQRITNLEQREKILQIIVDNAKRALKCDVVTLYTYNEDTKEIGYPPYASTGLRDKKGVQQTGFVSRDSVVGILLKGGKAHYANSTLTDEIFRISKFPEREGIASSAGIPLKAGGKSLGIFFVNYRKPLEFTTQRKKSIELFAAQAAIAINNAALYSDLDALYSDLDVVVSDLKRKQRHLRKVHEAGTKITSKFNHQQILDEILKQAVESISGEMGETAALGTIQEREGNDLVFRSTYSRQPNPELEAYRGKHLPLEKTSEDQKLGITVRAFNERKPQLVPDVFKDDDYHCIRKQTRSEVAVPLMDDDGPIGVLDLESDEPGAFDQNDVEALQALSEVGVLALKNARNIEQFSRARSVAVMGAWGADMTHDINREVGNIRRTIFRLNDRPDLPEYLRAALKDIDAFAEEIRMPDLPVEGVEITGYTRRESMPLDQAAEQEIDRLRKKYPGVDLTFEGHCRQQISVLHPRWIRRILKHLVTNAAREMAHQPVRQIIVRTAICGAMAEVSVQDTGPGVPPEVEPLLFKQSIPGKGGSNEQHEGRGLLLVQFLVEQVGGSIQLKENIPGKGARFVFTLPLLQVEPEESVEP